MKVVKDWMGREILPGMLVLYTTALGSSAVELRIGRVLSMGYNTRFAYDNQVRVRWAKSSRNYLPDAAETWIRNDKLTVLPDTFLGAANEHG